MDRFSTIIIISWFIILLFITFYAIFKERQELGCYRYSIAQQCDDDESVYVKGTRMEKEDTIQELYTKMTSILSYHEKGGVWKRCFILATILTLFAVLLITLTVTEKGRIGAWITIHLVFFTIMYFFFNYINYHHYRNLKRNGQEILDEIILRCKKENFY